MAAEEPTTILTIDSLQKVLLALLGGVIGFFSSLIIARINARKAPRYQLSWEEQTSDGLLGTKPDLSGRVQVVYDKRPVRGLYSVSFRVTNTGNRNVRDHALRFAFPDRAVVLEARTETSQPEYGVERTALDNGTPNSHVKYKFASLPRDAHLDFVFLVDSDESPDWKPLSFDTDETVEFVRRDVGRAKKDAERLPAFLILAFLWEFIPGLFTILPGYASLVGWLLRAALTVMMLPYVPAIVRVISGIVTQKRNTSQTFHVLNSDNVVIGEGGQAWTTRQVPAEGH